MIPVLRSIDGLLNRFDELSQQHNSFISDFDINFSDIENPLRNVARDPEEQRKTAENIAMITNENDDQMGLSAAVEDFNRRIIKSRCNNRPPSYSPNDSSGFFNRIPSRSSWATTESAPPPRTIQTIIKSNNSQALISASLDDLMETKVKLTNRIQPKVLPQNPPNVRRSARNVITTFTMETVNRLSRPKTTHQSPDQKSPPKRVHRRVKPHQNIKKETTESPVPSAPLLPPPPQIKRIIPTTIKSSPKRHKLDNKDSSENSKRIPMSNYHRTVVFLAPPPTICLTFPMQPELQSSRLIVMPKTATKKKATNIFTNKRSIIPSNRLMYLIT